MCLPTYIQINPSSPTVTSNSALSGMKSSLSLAESTESPKCFRNAACMRPALLSRQAAHAQVVRKRYFQAIGIFKEQPNAKSRVVPVLLAVPSPMTPPKTHHSRQPFVPLTRRSSSMSTASTCTTTSCWSTCSAASISSRSCMRNSSRSKELNQKKRVCFQQGSPRVVLIPSRHSYSQHVRHQLWISCDEMRLSYSRNVTEFRSEHWDWRRAVEEQDFVCLHGQLIHPVHIYLAAAAEQEQLYHMHRQLSSSHHHYQANLKNHFYRVMSAQQQRA